MHESGKPSDEIASALVYLAQQAKPFYSPPRKESKEEPERGDKKSSRRERSEKNNRSDSKKRKGRKSDPVFDDDGEEVRMETYKIHVGRQDEVTPSHIVGAIANEADISSKFIGHINIQESYSTIDLPEGMPEDLYKHLKKVRVKNKKLAIERANETNRGQNKKPKKRKPKTKNPNA